MLLAVALQSGSISGVLSLDRRIPAIFAVHVEAEAWGSGGRM